MHRFSKIFTKILEFVGKAYLTVIDFFSHWLELLEIKDKTSENVIDAFQEIFTPSSYPGCIIKTV